MHRNFPFDTITLTLGGTIIMALLVLAALALGISSALAYTIPSPTVIVRGFAAAGVTPTTAVQTSGTIVSGTLGMTSTGILCVYNNSGTWVKVSDASGCTF